MALLLIGVGTCAGTGPRIYDEAFTPGDLGPTMAPLRSWWWAESSSIVFTGAAGQAPASDECDIAGRRERARARHDKHELLRVRALQAQGFDPSLCTLANITKALAPGTAALERYLSGVYGPEHDRAKRKARGLWFAEHLRERVQVIYEKLLPRELTRQCTWPTVPQGRGDVHRSLLSLAQPADTLWVHRLDGPTPCPRSCLNYFAEPRTPRAEAVRFLPPPLPSGSHGQEVWVEVIHRFTSNCLEDRALWMLQAVGSGLWYRVDLESTMVLDFPQVLDEALRNQSRTADLRAEGIRTIVRHHCLSSSSVPMVEIAHVYQDAALWADEPNTCDRLVDKLTGTRQLPAGQPLRQLRFVDGNECRLSFRGGWPPERSPPCSCAQAAVSAKGERGHAEAPMLVCQTGPAGTNKLLK